MNWFVHSVITDVRQHHIDDAYDGVCEHVSVGSSAHMSGEQDSFGPVTRFLDCKACYVRARETGKLLEEEVSNTP